MANLFKYGKFIIKKLSKGYILRRVEFPRMSLKVDNSCEIAFLKDFNFEDECSAKEVLNILSEIEEVIQDLLMHPGSPRHVDFY
ncbi:MAG: hypothetical protein ACM3UT_06875 [Chloroflexota bacterium]